MKTCYGKKEDDEHFEESMLVVSWDEKSMLAKKKKFVVGCYWCIVALKILRFEHKLLRFHLFVNKKDRSCFEDDHCYYCYYCKNQKQNVAGYYHSTTNGTDPSTVSSQEQTSDTPETL